MKDSPLNQLEQLKQFSTVVADTGDVTQIRDFKPTDVTTNPSLILKAAQSGETQTRMAACVAAAKAQNPEDWQDDAIDRIAVDFGVSLSQLVPGYVSTEVNARLSFDADAMVRNGEKLMRYYQEHGVSPERILIKVAATYEGIEAARRLEAMGYKCNVTLVFHRIQAVAAARAGAFLISPFVGRIQDWYQKQGDLPADPALDPGVQSVKGIYQYFKQHQLKTVVMAASFRSTDQVLQLAGCDRLTISPALLAQLAQSDATVNKLMIEQVVQSFVDDDIDVSEAAFRWALNDDPMSSEKLAEGIRLFYQDHQRLRELIETL
nr:transaldolase family protein [Reinekea sp. G2M2-21]